MAATYTNNLNLAKPAYGDTADVGVINGNMDTLDGYCHDTRFMEAHAYDDQRATAYAVGEYCIYLGHYYRCTGATSGAWDSTKWVQTTIGDELEDIASGQGVSDMTGATASTAGTHGLVPAPAAGDQDKVLMGSGTWEDIPTPAADLADLDDVDITTPTGGQVLTYDDTNDEWVNADAPEYDVTKTVSGNPIEFDDGADAPLVKCVSAITGYQEGSGTPSPDNIRPITAYTEGEISVDSGNLANWTLTSYADSTPTTLKKGTYTISADGSLSNQNWYISAQKSDNTYCTKEELGLTNFSSSSTTGVYYGAGGLTAFTFTIPEDAVTVKIGSPGGHGQKIMLERGSVAHNYIPYVTPTTHTTTFPSAIYRGSEDMVNGEVTTQKIKWTRNSSTMNNAESYPGWNDSGIADLIGHGVSGRYTAIMSVGSQYTVNTLGNNDTLFLPTDAYGLTQTEWIALAVDIDIVIELPTPTTSPITVSNAPIKSLSGYSHIESSTGDMEIEYITQREQPVIDLIERSQHVYSTQEQVVGTWVDGKDLYEKMFTATSPTSTTVGNYNAYKIAELTGVDTAIFVTGSVTDASDQRKYSLPYDRYYSNSDKIIPEVYVDSQTNTMTCYVNCPQAGNFTLSEVEVTIRYTKSASNNRSLSKGGSEPQEEPLVGNVDKVDKEVENDEKEAQKEPVEEKEEPVEEEPVEEPSEEEEQNEAER